MLARTHSRKQVLQIAESIRRFGFTNPVLISDAGEILAGHGRVLANNKLVPNAGWDMEILAIGLQGLIDLESDVELPGFSLAEIDLALDRAR